MRSEKAVLNTAASFILQITAIICGLIIPRLIIGTFGSAVNGLAASITTFLGYIAIVESGVAGVIRASLYKPFAENNLIAISGIRNAAQRFFRVIALIFLGYAAVLAVTYPLLVATSFDFGFSCSLVLIIGISTFFQYYFGASNQILLQSDQRLYVTSFTQAVVTVVNAVLVYILARAGGSIQIVKLGSALIFIVRPIFLHVYVTRKYNLDKNVPRDKTALENKWNGLGHHFAYLLHNGTDIAVLTVFTNLKEVSVYNVHFLVVASIKKLVMIFSSGTEAAFGNMIAKKEEHSLRKNLSMFEFMIFSVTSAAFVTAADLIVPFIALYTARVTDVDYFRPLFAYVLIGAEFFHCLRIPYTNVVFGAGHFRETRNGAFAEAFINISFSLILVQFWGLVGVAAGTLAANLFRTMQYALYMSRNIVHRPYFVFIKRLAIYALNAAVILLVFRLLPEKTCQSYWEWTLRALTAFPIAAGITLLTGIVAYREDAMGLWKLGRGMLRRKA